MAHHALLEILALVTGLAKHHGLLCFIQIQILHRGCYDLLIYMILDVVLVLVLFC